MRKWMKLVLLVFILALLPLWYRECVVVDSCLDRGGSWDREAEICKGPRS